LERSHTRQSDLQGDALKIVWASDVVVLCDMSRYLVQMLWYIAIWLFVKSFLPSAEKEINNMHLYSRLSDFQYKRLWDKLPAAMPYNWSMR